MERPLFVAGKETTAVGRGPMLASHTWALHSSRREEFEDGEYMFGLEIISIDDSNRASAGSA